MAATVLGINTYNVGICTHVTGATGSETPDTSQGTLLYLFAKTVMGNPWMSKEKLIPVSGGVTFGDRSGKRQLGIMFRNCKVIKFSGYNTNTEAMGAIMDQLYDWGLKTLPTRPFAFFYNNVDSKYLPLSWNSSGQQTKFMKCTVSSSPWKMEKGNVYIFEMIKIAEVS